MFLTDAILDQLPARIYFKDRDSRFVRVNRATALALGLADPAEAVGKSDADYFLPEHAAAALADEQRVLRTGEPLTDQEEVETWPDGRKTWALTSKLPWYGPDGAVIGTIGMTQDVTKTRNDLEHRRLAVECAGEGLWYRKLDTNEIWFSSPWKRMLGFGDDELAHDWKEWCGRIHKDDMKRVLDAVEDCIAGRTAEYDCVYRLRHKDGRYLCIRGRGRVFRDADGTARAFAGSHADITRWVEDNARHEHILDTVPSLIFVKDEDLRFTFVNKAVAETFGLSKADIIGKTDADLIDDEEQVRHFNADDRRMLGPADELEISEEELRTARGVRWLATKKVKLRPLPVAADQGVQVLGVATDITDLHQARAAVEHERELLHNLMDNVPDAIFFKDLNGRFTRVNKELARRVGEPDPKKLIGKTDADFFGAVAAAAARNEDQKVVATGLPSTRVVRHATAADGPRWRMVSRAPIRDRAGQVVALVGISRDITDLKEVQALLNQILDRMPQCVWVKDRVGKYVMCNKSFADRRGTTPDALIGTTDYDRWPKEVADRYWQKDQEVMAEDKADTFREIQEFPDRPPAVLQTSKVPLHDAEGRVVRLLGIYEDITQQLEDEKLRFHAGIAKSIRHCLKNWVAIVEGNVVALKYGSPGLAGTEACGRLEESLRYMKYAADLATSLTATDGIDPDRMTTVAVADVLVSVVKATADRRLHLGDCPPTARCRGSEPHLRNAVMELFVNARDFIKPEPDGRIDTWIEVGGGRLEVHVRDNGPGIPESLHAELFEPFKTREPHRTGMGLGYVQEVVNKHAGATIKEVGAPGQGAHFVLALPLAPTPEEAP